ncbi:hypothetical protein T4B_2542 [Trichinella pseudospiralis]|uniref:Uncharacterized protein n=1 Tax=Trichinella pseudospiralis TaxID=6337 RepID=A0A0V1GST5_TRIPS|nr:hypothetical protein T4B_2542 [Trichinella pseudospiralis]
MSTRITTVQNLEILKVKVMNVLEIITKYESIKELDAENECWYLYFEQHANHNCSQKRSWAKKCYRMHHNCKSERLKSTLMLNRGIRRLYMVALGAVLFVERTTCWYNAFVILLLLMIYVYFATTGVSTLPLACTLPPCSKVSMKVSERSQRVTVPEYCILRVGGYMKLGTSRSLKMYLGSAAVMD